MLDDLRKRGVNTAGLLAIEHEKSLLIVGEVGSFYELQLLNHVLRAYDAGKSIESDVTVAQRTVPVEEATRETAIADETHQLRNRLNFIVLGLDVLKKAVAAGDLEQCARVVESLCQAEPIASAAASRKSAPTLADQSILIIEDDLNQSLLLSGLLRQLGATVTQRRSAESARAVCDTGVHLDTILVDLKLIGADGTHFASWFRQIDPGRNTSLIALSATRPGGAKGIAPFDFWLPKPVKVDRLIRALLQTET